MTAAAEIWTNYFSPEKVKMVRATKTSCFIGVGAIQKISVIAKALKTKGIEKVLVITGKQSYKVCGAWDYVEKALAENLIEYSLFNKITPNPETGAVDEAVEQGRSFGAQAVLAIGGGSPNDAAKGVAVLLANPGITATELYAYEKRPKTALPIVSINTTHGTGTEINRFSVVSVLARKIKPGIVLDAIYPMYSIDDPALLSTLPREQTLYTAMDAFNHSFEAVTSREVTPLGFVLGQESIRLVIKYLPLIMENPANLVARYYLVYAAMIAGLSFENSAIHITHTMEHPMSAFQPALPHGLGLSVVLPEVVREMYPVQAPLIKQVMGPVFGELKGTADETEAAVEALKKWLASFGITQKMGDLGFKQDEIPLLIKSIYETAGLTQAIDFCPTKLDKEKIAAMYQRAF